MSGAKVKASKAGVTRKLAERSPAAKKLSSKEKKAKRKEELAAAKEKDDSVRNANAREDILEDCVAFKKFARNGVTLSLEYLTSEAMTRDTRDWCFDLLKKNMEGFYAEDWDDNEKRRELKEDEARFIVVRDEESSDPVAFLHLRFLFEEEVEVLYLYELQISEAVQRKGVGKFLMQLCEFIARKNAMKGVMLTCFKNNPAAMSFYLEKMKYEIDAISPSYVNPLAADDYTYEIISKIYDAEAKKVLKRRAEEARDCWLEEGLESTVKEMGKVTLGGPQ